MGFKCSTFITSNYKNYNNFTEVTPVKKNKKIQLFLWNFKLFTPVNIL